jgi:transcriptional regulator with XRE-family HTH domain
MQLYERCREARRRTGLSQEKLALELGVSRGAVAQWEMERGTSPSVDNLIALARRTGVGFEWLATERGPRVHGEPIAVEDTQASYGTLRDDQLTLLAAYERLPKSRREGLLKLLQP